MADVYFDSVNGLDANAGTLAAPKQTFSAALTSLNAGNRVLLKTGSQWFTTPTTTAGLGTITATGGCTLTYYGDVENGRPPILDGFIYLAPGSGGWTSLGDGRWQKLVTGINTGVTFARVFPGVTAGKMPIANGLMYVSTAAAVNTIGKFNVATGILTLYTGSTTIDPVNYFGGLAISANGTANFILRIFGSNILMQHIRFLGGGGSGLLLQSNAADLVNNRFEDIEVIANYTNGIALAANSATLACRNTTIIRPYVDAVSSFSENNGSSSKWGGQNGIQIIDYASNTRIVDPIIKRQRHTGLDLFDSRAVGSVQGTLVYTTGPHYGLMDFHDIDYGRAIGVLSTNWNISGLRIIGQCTYSQFSGIGILSRCSFRNLRPYGTIPSDANVGTDGAINWYNSTVSGVNLSVLDITFNGNLIENAYGYAFHQQYSSAVAATLAANTVKVYNNTIIDLRNYNNRQLANATTPTPWRTATIMHDAFAGGLSPDQLYKNNLIIIPSGATTVISRKTAAANTFDDYAVNGMTGAASNQQYATAAAAGLAADYTPETSSAAYRAGTHNGYIRDGNGRVRHNPPTVGAFEAAVTRTER